MTLRDFRARIAFNAEGGSGAGGGDAGAGAQGGGDNNAGSGEAFWSKYELPDGMKGASGPEAYDKLYNGWKGLRDQVAKNAPPKDAAGYTFEPAPELKGYFKNADDPMMKIARNVGLQVGMPSAHFAPFLNGVFGEAVKAGIIPPPWDPHAELDGIGNMVAPGKSGQERFEAIEGALREAEAFAPALADSMKLSPAGKKLLVSIAQEAGGVEVLRALKAAGKEIGLQHGGEDVQQGYNWDQYDRDTKDDRYSPRSAKYDKQWRETVDAKMRALKPR